MTRELEQAKGDVLFAAAEIRIAAMTCQEAADILARRQAELAQALEKHGDALRRLLTVAGVEP